MIRLFKVREKQRELAENNNGKTPVKKQSAGELRIHKGTIMTISKDRVVPFPTPDSSKMNENFATGGVLAAYQAVMTVVFFWFIN